MIHIDGSHIEGGGQILRTAVALSAVTSKPFTITNIRKARERTRGKGGMKEQHVQVVSAVKRLCNASVEGLSLGSTSLTFTPQKITKKKLTVKITTAGSQALVVQALLLATMYIEKQTIFQLLLQGGGTWNKWAPSMLYTTSVLGFFLEKLGVHVQANIEKDGFFPQGGALTRVQWKYLPTKISQLDLSTLGDVNVIHGISIASNHLRKSKVAERQADVAKHFLGKHYLCKISVGTKYVDSACPGSGILLLADSTTTRLGYDVVGEKGMQSETVGKTCAEGLHKYIQEHVGVDDHLLDQLLPFVALAKIPTIIKYGTLTNHARTNMKVIKQFLDVDFVVDEAKKTIRIHEEEDKVSQ